MRKRPTQDTMMILMLLTLLTCQTAEAFYPTVKNFRKNEYNAGAQNWCITQASDGNMWFANSGALEFDGMEWKLTYADNRTAVRSVMYDNKTDRLYFGATNEFGYISIGTDNRMTYTALTDSLGFAIGDIWAIHKTEKGLWLRENNSMYLYGDGTVKHHPFPDKVAVSAIIGGELYIFVNNHGLMKLSDDGNFTELPGTEALADTRVCSVVSDGNGGLCVVTATDGVYSYGTGRLTRQTSSFYGKLEHSNIYCAARNSGYIAFGTVDNGVYVYDISGGRHMHINTSSGLQNNTVLSMFFDRNGNLWLGLDKGIDLIELNSPYYNLFRNNHEYGSGYASEIFEGRLWLGTNQGLYNTDPDNADAAGTRQIQPVKGQVWHLLNYDGRLFCCHDKGIYIFRSGRMSHIPMNGAWKLEPLRKHPDLLLGSSYDRMFILEKNDGTWRFGKWIEGFDEASKVFEEDKDGRIWFSHWVKGLFRLTIDYSSGHVTGQEYLSKADGFPQDWGNVPMELDGSITFKTDNGFYRYDDYGQKAYAHERLNSIFSNPPKGTSIYKTPGNDFYFSSSKTETFCFRGPDGSMTVDSLSLNHIRTKRIQGFEDIRNLSDSLIMVNTEDGFSIINTAKLKRKDKQSLPAARTYIKEIYITPEDSLIFTSRDAERCQNAVITLPYRHNSLKFKAIQPEYESGNTVLYSFLLENYDNTWSQFNETNVKEYTKLPHGDYVFRVMAKETANENIAESYIRLKIGRPWYLSIGAFVVYGILLILAVCLVFKAVNFFYRQKEKKMAERREEEVRKEHMRLELEHKAQDLAASTMNVIRKNEILLDIDSNLVKVTEYIAEDRNKSLKILNKIRQEIRENIQHDDIWQKFEQNFDIVYNNFLKRLGESYPNLTIADKKLCTYLRMDLSSKDIAPLMNITVRSVEMARHRLRKKLNLSHEDNLTEFLQNFQA